MDNNKICNPQVHLCACCHNKTLVYIHTTSRTVNRGIKVMYPNTILCLKCYTEMKEVYPPTKIGDE